MKKTPKKSNRTNHLFNDIPSALTKGGIPDCFKLLLEENNMLENYRV